MEGAPTAVDGNGISGIPSSPIPTSGPTGEQGSTGTPASRPTGTAPHTTSTSIQGDVLPMMELELRTFTIMERSLYRKVPIRVSQLMKLRLRQFDLLLAQQRLLTIKECIKACEYVPVCDSILHRKPAGCPKCGVVHLGGHTNAVQYVRSQDKTSGVRVICVQRTRCF
jgi:hypothetical protein